MADVAVEHRSGVESLTPKEEACLRRVARRMSSKEIAAELGITKASVDTYCNRAREKLGVIDRYEAARLAVTQDDDRISTAILGLGVAVLVGSAFVLEVCYLALRK